MPRGKRGGEADRGPAEELHVVTVRLPKDLHDELKRLADLEDRSVNQTLRRLARQYVEEGQRAS